jgi:alpha-ketoglutarate-dependent taurine dioxygenase
MNPFDLNDSAAYQRWREQKLANYPVKLDDLIVEINNPAQLTPGEKQALLRLCDKTNMALYRAAREVNKEDLHRLGEQIGLHRLDHNMGADEDGISALEVLPPGSSQEYIPYTNRPINWHTDGYYNTPECQVRGFILHCARPAAQGGENDYLDHEIAYLLLRDADPAYIEAFMQPDVMTIPPNLEGSQEIRPECSGPVFSVHEGKLHMRYTARAKNIRWREDSATQAALKFLHGLCASGSGYVFHYRLEANEGVISNNALHTRSGFQNSPEQQRLLYRARYYDRVAG